MPTKGMIPIFAQAIAIIYAILFLAQLLFNVSWCEGVRWGSELLQLLLWEEVES